MKKICKAIHSVSLLLLLAVGSAMSEDHAASDSIQIGVILPLTGDFAWYGKRIQESILEAKTDSIDYIYEDEGCNPRLAVSAYKKLSNADKVKIFLGPWCGSPQVAVAPMIGQSKQLAILGSSAPRRVFDLSKGRVFAVQHSIEQESHFNADKAFELGARKVVIVFFENDFSRAHEAAFKGRFKGEVLDTLAYTSVDASMMKSLALKIKKLKPDTLYIPDAFPLMHGLLSEIYQNQMTDLKLFSVYSAQSPDVLKAIGKAGEGLFISYPRIGDKEAFNYFPKLAADILVKAVGHCGVSDTDCAIKFLGDEFSFDKHGVLEGELGLKIVRGGKFEWFKTNQRRKLSFPHRKHKTKPKSSKD